MKGKDTHPAKVEEAKVVYAETNNFAEAARQTKLARTTAFDVIKRSDDFEQKRTQVRIEFINKAIEPLMNTVDLANRKVKELSEEPNLKRVDLRELTGAVKDLKSSIENVGSAVNFIAGDVNTQINYHGQVDMPLVNDIWLQYALEDKLDEHGKPVKPEAKKWIDDNWESIERLHNE